MTNKLQKMTSSFINLSNELGLLKVAGMRAKELLQGQLTCNLDEVTSSQTRLGAHCNPQGRIISFFRIAMYHKDYILIMPKCLISCALNALKKYAPFYKVELQDLSDQIEIIGYFGEELEDFTTLIPKQIDEVLQSSGLFIIKILRQCYLIIGNNNETTILHQKMIANIKLEDYQTWKYLSITEGIPAIYPETTEKFLPHELNLHQLNAISFSKGCYTGQEIIARMQYRGKLKNRLVVAWVQSKVQPILGQDIYSHSGIAGHIVDYCKKDYNDYQLMIVTNEENDLYLDSQKTVLIETGTH